MFLFFERVNAINISHSSESAWCAFSQFAHLIIECTQTEFAWHIWHLWSNDWWFRAHILHWASFLHLEWVCSNFWHLMHCVDDWIGLYALTTTRISSTFNSRRADAACSNDFTFMITDEKFLFSRSFDNHLEFVFNRILLYVSISFFKSFILLSYLLMLIECTMTWYHVSSLTICLTLMICSQTFRCSISWSALLRSTVHIAMFFSDTVLMIVTIWTSIFAFVKVSLILSRSSCETNVVSWSSVTIKRFCLYSSLWSIFWTFLWTIFQSSVWEFDWEFDDWDAIFVHVAEFCENCVQFFFAASRLICFVWSFDWLIDLTFECIDLTFEWFLISFEIDVCWAFFFSFSAFCFSRSWSIRSTFLCRLSNEFSFSFVWFFESMSWSICSITEMIFEFSDNIAAFNKRSLTFWKWLRIRLRLISFEFTSFSNLRFFWFCVFLRESIIMKWIEEIDTSIIFVTFEVFELKFSFKTFNDLREVISISLFDSFIVISLLSREIFTIYIVWCTSTILSFLSLSSTVITLCRDSCDQLKSRSSLRQ